MVDESWTSWTPAWAPAHVRGRYTERRWSAEEQAYEEQRVEAECSFVGCGAIFRRTCSSGRVREHIATFARVHLHRDPLG